MNMHQPDSNQIEDFATIYKRCGWCFTGKFVITAACANNFPKGSRAYFMTSCQRVMKIENQVPNCVSYLREITSTSVYSIGLHQKPLIAAFWSRERLTTQHLTPSLSLFSKNWSWQICCLLTQLDLQVHCWVKGERMVGKARGSIKVAK